MERLIKIQIWWEKIPCIQNQISFRFIQCYECGNTFPIHETFTESKIKDSVQTTDNPFENESTFLSIDSRATQRRKGKKHKGRFSYKEQEDPDIHTEIEKYGSDNVRIIQ